MSRLTTSSLPLPSRAVDESSARADRSAPQWAGLRAAAALAVLAAASGTAQAKDGTGPDAVALERCRVIVDAAARLACYDTLAARSAEAQRPADAAAAPPIEAATPAEPAAPRGPAAAPAGNGLRPSSDSFLSRYWELDAVDKRGTFNFSGYRPNFLLPLHVTTHINTRPQSPTREAVTLPGYRRVEAKLQLSLRTKLLEDIPLTQGDLWFGYTQQSLWQVWSTEISAPFRSTDYEPELIYIQPIPASMQPLLADWRWRYLQLSLTHQSNGQGKPLSRSWNRVSLGTGLERGDLSLTSRLHFRLPEGNDDDNPDLLKYRGRLELAAAWTPGRSTASLLWRTGVREIGRGALQLDWTYPVDIEQPNGLRWYAQLFTGYAETLLDYNVRQTSLGFGLTLFNF